MDKAAGSSAAISVMPFLHLQDLVLKSKILLQVNLFIAVLKIKFAKAQTLFHSKLAKMSRKKRKNIIGRVMDKGKKRISEQVKKKREASEVSPSI